MRRKALWPNLLCVGVVLAVWATGDGHVAFQVGLHNSGQLCRRSERSGRLMMSALRRDVILGTSGLLSELKPICEVPLHRLKPVEGQVGGQFVSISAFIAGEAVELMLDSGLSEGMVTPALVKKLHLKPIGTAEGATAGGGETVQLVQLEDLRLECGELLAPVTAAVASFPEEKVDKNWVLKGMLGYQALQSYDAELDFPKGVLRLWRPGEGAAKAREGRSGRCGGRGASRFRHPGRSHHAARRVGCRGGAGRHRHRRRLLGP